MVTLASSSSIQEHNKTGHDSKGVPPEAESHLQQVQLYLAQRLQTSLELTELLRIFFETLQDLIGADGLAYRCEEFSLSHCVGRPCSHHANYRIRDRDQDLGQVDLSRERKFTEPELLVVEILIGSLFYPLRNALLYRRALASAMKDPLTGIGNRAAMDEALARELELAKRYQRPFCLMLVDIDHFKSINDTIGHLAGDHILRHLVATISDSLRQVDEVFRYGGEEFVVLLNNTDRTAAGLVAERVRRSLLAQPPELEGAPVVVTISIGVSSWVSGDSDQTLFDRADQALYQAKHGGRNRVAHGDD